MIGIKSIASYVPASRIDNFEQAKRFDESEEFIREKIGAFSLPVKAEDQETSDLAVEAVRALLRQGDLKPEAIDALVVVTQNGDGSGLPHTSAIVHGKLGLQTRVAAFDLSLGCSGYVYGLSVLRGLMQQAGMKNGVLVTADPYSKIMNREDRITTLLFGDAATATWLCEEGLWKFGVPILETDGGGHENLCVRSGKFEMNGRQVFNFASKRVPVQIEEWLERNNKSPCDIDLYCLHQGSASIVDAISKKFPDVKDRFVKDIEQTGNTVSSSIPLLLEKYLISGDLTSALISGFGVGLSWATNGIFKES